MKRLRLPEVERLSARIAIGMGLLVIVPLVSGLYLLSSVQYEHAVDARRSAADLENRASKSRGRHINPRGSSIWSRQSGVIAAGNTHMSPRPSSRSLDGSSCC
jgi:hypothetical protein